MNPSRLGTLVIQFLLSAAFGLSLTGCASIHRLDSTQYQVIAVPQEIQSPSKLEGVRETLAKGEPVIFKVTGGQQMPLRLTMDLPMGTLENAESMFNFNRDTFFLISKNSCRLSPDGQRWANVANPKALSKLFGFTHGEMKFAFTSGTNQAPRMNLEVKVK